jgi:hypothetical protein
LSAEAAWHLVLSLEKRKFSPITVIVLPTYPEVGLMLVITGLESTDNMGNDDVALIKLGLLKKTLTKESPTGDWPSTANVREVSDSIEHRTFLLARMRTRNLTLDGDNTVQLEFESTNPGGKFRVIFE